MWIGTGLNQSSRSRPVFSEMTRLAASSTSRCFITATRPMSSKNSHTRFTLQPGSFFSTSRMRRRGSLASDAKTASMSSGFICNLKVTYRWRDVNPARRYNRRMADDLRESVLRGIAHNRTPGFHFAGNFLGIELVEIGKATRVVMDAGPHNIASTDEVDLATVFMVADIALAASIRSQLAPHTRLATVSMQLQLNGAPVIG